MPADHHSHHQLEAGGAPLLLCQTRARRLGAAPARDWLGVIVGLGGSIGLGAAAGLAAGAGNSSWGVDNVGVGTEARSRDIPVLERIDRG